MWLFTNIVIYIIAYVYGKRQSVQGMLFFACQFCLTVGSDLHDTDAGYVELCLPLTVPGVMASGKPLR